jgi:nicotinamidase-related amidase
MQRPALIVIDMLNDFLATWPEIQKQRLISSINDLIGMMRQRHHPILWVRQEFEPDLRDAFPEMIRKGIQITIRGTDGCRIVSGLHFAPSDPMIVKKRYSAFFKTDLEEVLKRLMSDELVLAGINTHACVRATAIDAYQRDWKVIVASDCVDSYDRQHHEISMKYMQDKIASVMRDRAAFIKRYLRLKWPEHHLYDAMFSAKRGDSFVADMLVRCVQAAHPGLGLTA